MVYSMARESISESLASWDRAAAAKRFERPSNFALIAERLRIHGWSTLPLTDYALGQDTQDTVSYWLEYRQARSAASRVDPLSNIDLPQQDDGSWRFPRNTTRRRSLEAIARDSSRS